MNKLAAALSAAVIAGLTACAPTQSYAPQPAANQMPTVITTGSTSTTVLARPAQAVTVTAGQSVGVVQTISASAVGIEPTVTNGVTGETPFAGLTVTPLGLPIGWSLVLERATVQRAPVLAGGRAQAGQVRLYLRVTAPPRFGRVPRALSYRLSYKNVDTALALNVTVRR